MSIMPWFRLYSDILDDRKIKRICKRTRQSKALVIGVWVSLLAIANSSPTRGELTLSDDIPVDIDDLEDELDLPKEIIGQLIDEFARLDMICGNSTLKITNWEKRQFKSDNSTQRVRDYRKRQDETLPQRSSIVIEAEADTESDKEVEVDKEKEPAAAAFAEIAKLYESEIGALTPMIADIINEMVKEYPHDWIIKAIGEAAKYNARNMSYIEAILKKAKARGNMNGQKRKRGDEPFDPHKYISGEYAKIIDH